jgi:hypothetical protein
VELRTDKTDETGKPIHEECHAQKARSKATQKQRSSDSTKDSQENLSQAIVSFLDSICNPSDDLKHCPVCGSDFEYRDCSLFYNGRSWMKEDYGAPSVLKRALCGSARLTNTDALSITSA